LTLVLKFHKSDIVTAWDQSYFLEARKPEDEMEE
jgi:hypothetical protein